jgi:hypothetical protein
MLLTLRSRLIEFEPILQRSPNHTPVGELNVDLLARLPTAREDRSSSSGHYTTTLAFKASTPPRMKSLCQRAQVGPILRVG